MSGLYALDGVVPILPESGNYWIAPGATVIGNVQIGEGVSIWFGTVIRGDNERITIGDRSNIQENCVLHTDPGFPMTIGQDCTIGHLAMLHGCTIGDSALVGMGATVLNGASIGAGALLGATALLTEGKVIPDRMLAVGAPAKAIRPRSADDLEGQIATATHYMHRMERYRRGLVSVDG